MAAPNDEYLIIGLQPEYKIQESPFQAANRIASTTESFQNKAPNTGLSAAPGPLKFPSDPASAAPVNTNYNGLGVSTTIPRVFNSGLVVQGPNDGPTALIDRAEQVEAGYNAVTINEVNRMLASENYSGAEKLLGRELTLQEIQQRQLGEPDRYTQAKAGVPAGRFPAKAVVTMPPNASNPPPLPAKAEANPYGLGAETSYSLQPNNIAVVQQTAEGRNNPFLPSAGNDVPQPVFNMYQREKEFIDQLEVIYKKHRDDLETVKGKIPKHAQDRAQAQINKEKKYIEERRAGLNQEFGPTPATEDPNQKGVVPYQPPGGVVPYQGPQRGLVPYQPPTTPAIHHERGLVPHRSGHGIEFGRFLVHGGKLAEGTLSMKYAHNGRKISDLPNRHLSPALQEAMHQVIHGRPMTGTGLHDHDLAYIRKVIDRAQAGGDVRAALPLPPSQQRRSRMMVILGEMEAGNDSPELKTELERLLKYLLTTKNLSRSDALLIRSTFL